MRNVTWKKCVTVEHIDQKESQLYKFHNIPNFTTRITNRAQDYLVPQQVSMKWQQSWAQIYMLEVIKIPLITNTCGRWDLIFRYKLCLSKQHAVISGSFYFIYLIIKRRGTAGHPWLASRNLIESSLFYTIAKFILLSLHITMQSWGLKFVIGQTFFNKIKMLCSNKTCLDTSQRVPSYSSFVHG